MARRGFLGNRVKLLRKLKTPTTMLRKKVGLCPLLQLPKLNNLSVATGPKRALGFG